MMLQRKFEKFYLNAFMLLTLFFRHELHIRFVFFFVLVGIDRCYTESKHAKKREKPSEVVLTKMQFLVTKMVNIFSLQKIMVAF